MVYVILMPHSNTNNSDKHRVVWDKDWAAYANGATVSMTVAGEFKTYPEAEELRDRLNGKAEGDELLERRARQEFEKMQRAAIGQDMDNGIQDATWDALSEEAKGVWRLATKEWNINHG